MKLMEKYFKATEDNPSLLAARMGCQVSTITRIMRGERRPSYEMCVAIQKGTGGKVKAPKLLLANFLEWKEREREAAKETWNAE